MDYNHPKNGKFVIYGRVSTGSDEQQNSIKVQTTESNEFSLYENFKDKYHYSCYDVFSDEASGTTDNRTGYQEMLFFFGIERKVHNEGLSLPTGNIKRKKYYVYTENESRINYVRDVLKINYIMCKNTARWTREADFSLIQLLRNHGIYIYFRDENIDTFSSEVDVMLGVVQSLDRNKSYDTSKKVRSGMEASIKLGKVRTNSLIYGYELERRTRGKPTKLVAIPEEAEVVRLIYELYIEKGLGSRQIVNELTKRGIVTRKKITKNGKVSGGIPFSVSTVKRILSNEKYCGYVNVEKKWDTGVVFNHKSPKKIHDYEIKPSPYIEAIISPDIYTEARRICKLRSDATSPRGRNTGNSIYYGKIVCGLCGHNYIQNGDHDSNGVYHKKMNCGNKKKNGISACCNSNISFAELDRRYEDFAKNFNLFLKIEIGRQKRFLLLFLIVVFEYYFNDKTSVTKVIEDEIRIKNELYDELLLQRIELGPNAKHLLNKKLEDVASGICELEGKLEEILKFTERLRPIIDRLLFALETCCKIDINKKCTAEEIKGYDIKMIAYPDDYDWKMPFENYEYLLEQEPKIAQDLYLYMNDENLYLEDEEINRMIEVYYDKYGVKDRYYL